MAMKFSVFHESRVGGRLKNEDACGYNLTDESFFMVLADGMGGHLYGELASRLAVSQMLQQHKDMANPLVNEPVSFLRAACLCANNAILDYAQENSLLEVPRTTLVACLVQQGVAYHVHLGDSRLYLIDQKGNIKEKTRDHTRLQFLLDQGISLAEGEFLSHPDRNRVYSCLGSDSVDLEAPRIVPLVPGDIILLCSDGLWNHVDDSELWVYLSRFPLTTFGPALMNLAEYRGGPERDNLTMLVFEWARSSDDDNTVILFPEEGAGASRNEAPYFDLVAESSDEAKGEIGEFCCI